jgi:hypothetical protein
VASGFQAAFNDLAGRSVDCNNGREFGNGLLVHVPAPHGAPLRYGGIYPMQDARDEYRAWLCLRRSDALAACTTHLPDGAGATALAQCAYLFGTVIPGMWMSSAAVPTVIGADLNLGAADSRPCRPFGWGQVDDGTVQHIFATADLPISAVQLIDMRGTTDHPGLLAIFDL